MQVWGEYQKRADELAAEIKEEVLALGTTQKVENVIATYNSGRGTYDYQSIAMRLEPDQEIVDANTKPVTDWKKVCEDAGMTEEIKEKFYTPGSPSVSLKLKV